MKCSEIANCGNTQNVTKHIKRTQRMQMSLTDTIKGLGHYARKAAKAITKPINTAIALVAISSALSFNEAQAQNTNYKSTNGEIIENGYGKLFIKNEENNGVAGATVVFTPISVPGDSIPEPYTYTTDGSGVINYDVLVFCDRDVAVQNNYNIEVIQARPNPSTDFTFNFITNERPNNPLEIRSINGALVGKYDLENHIGNVAIYHADLSNQANGIYFATTTIDGKPQLSKLVKINGAIVGNLGSSAKELRQENFYKSSQANEAIYEVSITAQGYYDLVEQKTITQGDNGWGGYTLISNEAPPIDNQDLEGYVWKLENTSLPLANAQVRATVLSTNVEYNATSDANGHFIINGLPLGEEIIFDVGGVAGRYSFAGTNYTTPGSISNPADSVNANFSAVLPLKLSSSSANHIRDQTSNGTHQDTIWFYLGNSFNTTQKNNIRNNFANLQSDENNRYIFAEKFTASNIGINIEPGTYNTQAYPEGFITPLGNILNPILYANTTMAGAGIDYYVQFVHEIKRALGFDGVAWVGVNSVMETPVQEYTQEDKDIAQFVERPYWNAVYQENKTWIDLNKIVEDMPGSKSLQSSKTSNSFNEDLEFNYQTK